jgi:dTDP-4-dehydrorhamnose reductase
MNDILVLGDGLLGSEIVKQTHWNYISRKKDNIDFCNISSYRDYLLKYNIIVNCIGFTKTYSEDKEINWNVNYKAVADLVDNCNNLHNKIVHISTDYVYTYSKSNATELDVPVHCANWYSYTKLLSDGYIQLKSKDYLLIRTSFKPIPFPYEKAIVNQIGNFDYVDKISKLIIELIKTNANGVYNVGTDIKTIYELAKQTKPTVLPMTDKIHPTTPENIIMNVDKMRKYLKENS